MNKRRPRAPNYSLNESIHLCNIIEKYKTIIENKNNDSVTLREKQQAWVKVAEEYNSTTPSYHRTVDSLQFNYKNIKRKARKEVSAKEMGIPVNQEFIEVTPTLPSFVDDWKGSDGGASETERIDTFEDSKIQAIKQEKDIKKEILKTGDGSTELKEEVLIDKVCSLVGPAINGQYTIYNDDNILTAPQNDSQQPIEMVNLQYPSISSDQPNLENNRANLKRKTNPNSTVRKRKKCNQTSVSAKFKGLADEKIELVQLQKKLILTQIKAEEERIKNFQLENNILMLKFQQEKHSLEALK